MRISARSVHFVALRMCLPCHDVSMTSSPARGDLRAFDESLRLPTDELVSQLREALGAKLVAYVASIQETRTVGEWADGEREPQPEVEVRLRVAYHVASLLLEKNSPVVVQVWFQGANELVGGRAPARLLRDGDLDEMGPAVVAAAREFTA